MGIGASTASSYKLRLVEEDGLGPLHELGKHRRKSTAVYPGMEPDKDGESSQAVSPMRSKSRRGSGMYVPPPEVTEGRNSDEVVSPRQLGMNKKQASLARMGSKLDITSSKSESSGKNMLLSAPPVPGQLQTQASQARMTRSNSVIATPNNRTGGTVCSNTHPWLLKQANLQGSNLSEYEFGKIIGRGLMGTVRICKTKAGKYLVFKAVRKDYIVKHNDHRHVQNEKEILKTLNCSFCVKMFGTFQDRNNIYYALEFCPGGELFQRLGRKKSFPPEEAKFYISEIFVAIEHVQECGFVYRDLKPENVILDEEGHCKLVDFGFSTPCPDNTTKLKTLCGTPAYLSPEQLDGKFTNGYTRVVDWWSFGVLVFELLTGRTPFSRNNKESHYEIFLRILNKKISFPWSFDPDSKDLIMKLCHSKLEQRLCYAPDIKIHKYFNVPWDAVAARRLVPPFVPRIKDEGDIHYFRTYPNSMAGAAAAPNTEDLDANKYGYFDF